MKGLSKLIMQLEALGVFEELRKIRQVAGGAVTSVSSSVSTFLGLSDTPDTYTGQSGKVVSVKGDETGLEFISGGSGETNTASNVGAGGVGVFKQKTGVDLEFKNINAASSKVSVANDAGNNEVDIDVVEANISHDNIGGVSANDHHNQAHDSADHTKATTAEIADVAAAESAGTSDKVPAGDHVHAHGSGYLPNAHHNQSHSDSDHTAGFGTPTGDIDIADAASAGVATTHTRSDHQHAFPAPSTGYPVDVAAAEADGSGTTPARSDHVHAHGSGYLPDAHHDKSHGHTGGDGSGTVSHANLTSVSANQHHNQAHSIDGADHTLAGGTDGQALKATGATSFAFEDDIAVIAFIIDGGGSVITAGMKGGLEIPFACVIQRATLLEISDTPITGSIVVDIWKDTYANYPPVDADSITASAPPTLSSAVKSQDSTLTGWTTTIAAGDILFFNADATPTSVKKILVSLKVRKT